MPRSTATVGKITVVNPFSRALMAVMSVTDVMTTAVVLLEVVIDTLSRGATVVWSFRESLMILEGRRVLADLATAA